MNEYFNIYKVKNFNTHKQKLIELIHKIPKTTYTDKDQQISHTDWQIPSTMYREYFDYFIKNIFYDFEKELKINFNADKIVLSNLWFQKYNCSDFHNFHRHGSAHFSNVFFIELPKLDLKTEIYNLKNERINIDINEGDILTFPAFLKHKSVENKNINSKIIISFNIDLE